MCKFNIKQQRNIHRNNSVVPYGSVCVVSGYAQALKHINTFVRRACYGPSLLDSCLTADLYPTERCHCWAAGSGISPVQLDSPQHSLPSGNPHHLQHHNSSSYINVAYCGSWRIRANETSSLDVFALKSSTSSSFIQHSYTSPSATQQRALRPAVTGPTSYRSVLACLNHSITSEGKDFNE